MSFKAFGLSSTAQSHTTGRVDGYSTLFGFRFKARGMYMLFHISIYNLTEELLHSAPSVAAHFPVTEDTEPFLLSTDFLEISHSPPTPLHISSAC